MGEIDPARSIPDIPFPGRRYRVKVAIGGLALGQIVSSAGRNGMVRGGGFHFWDSTTATTTDLFTKDIYEGFKWSDILEPYDNFEYERNELRILSSDCSRVLVVLKFDHMIADVLKRKNLFIVLYRDSSASRQPIRAYREDGSLAWELAPYVYNPEMVANYYWAYMNSDYSEDELECFQEGWKFIVETETGKIIKRIQGR